MNREAQIETEIALLLVELQRADRRAALIRRFPTRSALLWFNARWPKFAAEVSAIETRYVARVVKRMVREGEIITGDN